MKKSKKIILLISALLIISTNDVKALSYIDEIRGKDRYETASMIAKKQDYKKAILVNADLNLADGLSASGLSGAINGPILLTQKNSIPKVTEERLKDVNKVYIIGSEDVIYTSVEDKIKSTGIEVCRLGGKNRIETSYEVAKEISKIKNIDKVILTNGYSGEADAMSVSSVAVRDGIPIILTDGRNIEFDTNDIKTYIIGLETVMSNNIVNKTNGIRLGGNNRFETNKKVVNYFYKDPKEFYLANGYKLVDALTGSSLAKENPIILVDSKSDKSILKGASKVMALGGIDKNILNQSIDSANGIEVTFTYSSIPENIKSKMTGKSMPMGAKTKFEDLSYLKLTYYGFDNKTHNGEMVVDKRVAKEVVEIFKELYDKKYPIEKIRLIDEYNANDNLSMKDNNSSSFAYRVIAGTNKLSNHSKGLAIDINPLQNPHVKGSSVSPIEGKTYVDRKNVRKGMIIKNDAAYQAFTKRGWKWGGNWSNPDYQHFEKTL